VCIVASFNRVILMGNLTRDPEIRYIPSGTAVCDVGLAVNDRRKGANGEWIDETTFVDVTLWGRTAEIAGEYLSKGSPMLIEGRLKLDSWEGTDGQKRSKLKVICENLRLLGGRGGGPGGSGGGGSGGGGSGGGGSGGGGSGESGGKGSSRRDNDYNQAAPAHNDFEAPQEPSGDDIPF
jgi:single-strand DNA-binding protein